MSVDSERVVESISVVHDLWSGALVVGMGNYTLRTRIGLVLLASLAAVYVCLLPTPLTASGTGTRARRPTKESTSHQA